TQVRAASSPRTLGRLSSPLSPTRGLASAFMESPMHSGSDVYHTPVVGRQTTPPPTEAEKKLLDDFIKTPTPPRPTKGDDSASVNNNKRKRAAVAFEAPDQGSFAVQTQQPEGEWEDEDVDVQLSQQRGAPLEDQVDSILDDDGKYEIESQTDETALTEDGASFSPVVNS
ncbi:4719_t:CDS:2, partial [Acaulospora colombiana]